MSGREAANTAALTRPLVWASECRTGDHVRLSAPLLPGETLAGKYCIERVLGKGGMGMVLGARNLYLNERVAIKVLNRELTPDVVRRFLGEGRAAGHP